MPIPPFDKHGVLPPHSGAHDTPDNPHEISPYTCTIEEFTDRFATNATRIALVEKLIDYRNELRKHGLIGFQWIAGGFVELKDTPSDIDSVSFLFRLPPAQPWKAPQEMAWRASAAQLADRTSVKTRFTIDSFVLQPSGHPSLFGYELAFKTQWHSFFTHSRGGIWKGILQMELSKDPTLDHTAAQIITARKSV